MNSEKDSQPKISNTIRKVVKKGIEKNVQYYEGSAKAAGRRTGRDLILTHITKKALSLKDR